MHCDDRFGRLQPHNETAPGFPGLFRWVRMPDPRSLRAYLTGSSRSSVRNDGAGIQKVLKSKASASRFVVRELSYAYGRALRSVRDPDPGRLFEKTAFLRFLVVPFAVLSGILSFF